ncbi:MAG: hypothetical protein WD887_02570 [Candidatus Saccharimonadales bacterium]
MLIRSIASVTALLVAMICVLLVIEPSDPLFYSFVSGNLWTAVGKFLLMLGVVILAFKNKFNYSAAPAICAWVGASLIGLGLLGLMVPSVDYALFTYIKVLDFLLAMEVGVILSLAALSYERGHQKLPRISRPRQLTLGLPYHNIRSYLAAKEART